MLRLRTNIQRARESGLIYGLTQEAQHTGVMVALVPSAQDAARLALEGGVPESDLHVTLLYFPDASAMPIEVRQSLVDNVRSVTERYSPLVAKTFGIGIFNPLSDKPALVLNVGGVSIDAFRRDLETVLWSPADHRPWAAHMTLRYFAGGEKLPDYPEMIASGRMGSVVFDRVRIAFAGQSIDIPFAESPMVVAAREARAIFEAQRAGARITANRSAAPEVAGARLNVTACRATPKVEVDGDLVTFPVVPFVQGVRQAANAQYPELYLISEFGKALDSARRMPVVFQHPYRAGDGFVSIHDPPFDPDTGVIVGMVTDAKIDGERIVTQVAVWRSRFRGPRAEAVIQAILAGYQIEVSIGAFTKTVPIGGWYKDQPYFGVLTDPVFDHLALLPVGTAGACSIEAGCGAPRA